MSKTDKINPQVDMVTMELTIWQDTRYSIHEVEVVTKLKSPFKVVYTNNGTYIQMLN